MTTTLEGNRLVASVEKAIADLKLDFQPTEFVVEPDNEGGAHVCFGPVSLTSIYNQVETWLGGHIPAQIPYADVYPIFVRGDLSRADGKPLQVPITNGHMYLGRSAVQVSRRSNRRDATIETVKMKFKKVLQWLNEQS